MYYFLSSCISYGEFGLASEVHAFALSSVVPSEHDDGAHTCLCVRWCVCVFAVLQCQALQYESVWHNLSSEERESLIHMAATSYSKHKRMRFRSRARNKRRGRDYDSTVQVTAKSVRPALLFLFGVLVYS